MIKPSPLAANTGISLCVVCAVIFIHRIRQTESIRSVQNPLNHPWKGVKGPWNLIVTPQRTGFCVSNKNLSGSSLLWLPVRRYGYHVSKTSYVICNDPPTIQKIFSRIRNFDGEGLYPKTCGGVQIVHVRDVTTGYDSSQPNLRSVRREQITAGVIMLVFGFCATEVESN